MKIPSDIQTDEAILRQNRLGYWETRRHMLYYKALFQFVCIVGYNAKSIIDVGSASSEYLDWMSWIPRRVMLDKKITKKGRGIEAIEVDFFDFSVESKFDVALCCQVLEHIEYPEKFCAKLKSICKRLIITVPYKWTGYTPDHIQDPVDELKLKSWMGIDPNNFQLVTEPFRETRLIAYYDLENCNAKFEKNFIFEAIASRAIE